MPEETNPPVISSSTVNDKITYSQFGFQSARRSESHPEAITGYLERVYEKFLGEQKLDEESLKQRIAKLKLEVQRELERKSETGADLASFKTNKQDKENEIEELELEKIEIRNGDGETGDTIPFVIGAFITLMLTLYLFVFYSSSGYSAFYGIKANTLGFINPDVFTDASDKGPGVIALIIFFPVIFLGLGFLIHDSLEKNNQLVKANKPKHYGFIISLLSITLVTDAFMGYKISEGVYNNDFNAGRVTDPWHFGMIYSDITFYLILTLGFVVYVIWGFLLHYVLSHPYLKTESEKVKLLTENINGKIVEKRFELSELVRKINTLEGDIVGFMNSIDEKRKAIIGYETGDFPINIASLRGSVGEFMGGWQHYTHGNCSPQQAGVLIDNAITIQNSWIEHKVTNLQTDNGATNQN